MSTVASPETSPPETPSGVQSPPEQQLYPNPSCMNCRRRKVKCDKLSPCSNCSRMGTLCEFAPRKRAPRRMKSASAQNSNGRVPELLKRLNQLEGRVHELSGQADSEESIAYPTSPASAGPHIKRSTENSWTSNKIDDYSKSIISDVGETISSPYQVPDEKKIGEYFGTLVIESDGGPPEVTGRSNSDTPKYRYVDHSFWARLSEEVSDIRKIVIDDSFDEVDEEKTPSVDGDHHSFVFGHLSSNVNLKSLHPLPSQFHFYLQVFREKVDPLIKILHMPTLENIFNEAQINADSITKGVEALMFSLYFSVITSMSDQESTLNLAQDRRPLIERYRFGAEQALARAGALDSPDLITLQAYVLYLSCVRVNDGGKSRVGWTLTRAAIGVAESLGLHRDGSAFGLPVFECEMRRRLWWQLCILDFRMAEMHGADTSIREESFDTKLPSNLNDSDLLENAESPPASRLGLTEMTITLLACDASSTVRIIQQSRPSLNPIFPQPTPLSIDQKESLVHQLEKQFSTKYLQYCSITDLESSVSYVTEIMCKVYIYRLELTSYLLLKQSGVPLSTKDNDKTVLTAIKMLECSRKMKREIIKQWQWFYRSFFQRHVVAFLFGELCVRDPDDLSTYAWAVLDSALQDWRDSHELGKAGLLPMTMRKLIARARRKREFDLSKGKKTEVPKAPVPAQHTPQEYAVDDKLLISHTDFMEPSQQSSPTNPLDEQWPQQQYFQFPAPTPWLLEDSAMKDLGLDMSLVDGDMDWDEMHSLDFNS